jgi:riboflavin transporter FmnP
MPSKQKQQDDESESERLNRNFDDLLQELRVSQNGTQILFAFLLTVPFSNGFAKVTDFQQGFYFAALLLAALSAAMLIAPAVMHRVLFRQHQKKELVGAASRVALGGQTLLVFAVSASVFLVGDFLYGHTLGAVMAVVVGLWTGMWFFALPLYIRFSHGHWAAEHTSST